MRNDLQGLRVETEFFPAFGTIATVSLDNLARGFKLKSSVQQIAAFRAYYSLRQSGRKSPVDEAEGWIKY